MYPVESIRSQQVASRLRAVTSSALLWMLVILLAGCRAAQAPATPVAESESSAAPEPTVTPTPTPAVIAETPTLPPTPAGTGEAPAPISTSPLPEPTAPALVFGYTYQQPNGNRRVAGKGSLPAGQPLDIPLAGQPEWVVAAPAKVGSLWVVVLSDSRVQAFQVADDGVTEITIEPEQLLPGMPPHLVIQAGRPTLLDAPVDAPSPLTHPILLPEAERLAFIHSSGELILGPADGAFFADEAGVTRLEVDALPDARLLVDERERILLLTAPTTRYAHGVLGDPFEAAGITLIETRPTPRIMATIPIPEPTVIEGIAPIWADLTGDGGREIIVTQSNAALGAQVVVYDEKGQQLATGPAIGRGNRWRHQLVVAPFGPAGELELVDVLTPHIGGTVEFYQIVGDTLEIVARIPGFTSHVIGTRNLDMAVAGDFDGDDRIELLIPTQARTELGGLRRTAEGAAVAWLVPVGGVVNTNLAAVTLPGDRVAVGIGRSDGVLRLWRP